MDEDLSTLREGDDSLFVEGDFLLGEEVFGKVCEFGFDDTTNNGARKVIRVLGDSHGEEAETETEEAPQAEDDDDDDDDNDKISN